MLFVGAIAFNCDSPEPTTGLLFTPETAAMNFRGEANGVWNPAVSATPSFRGGVYQRVAPAVVVVRTRYGHGTGFLVAEGDRVLTAHHVIADGWFVDQERSATYVFVFLGKLENGAMKLCDQPPVRAYVIAVDREQDLALLGLAETPKECGGGKPLVLAGRGATPEAPCAVVGHPTAGGLWSFRTGIVSNLGKSPGDLVRFLIPVLGMSEENRERYKDRIELMGAQDIVFTDIGSGPGDSGGPLVNMEGELIGVTCAVPTQASSAQFTYHVDLKPVRRFLDRSNSDRTSLLYAPDAYRINGPLLVLPQPYVLTGSSRLGDEPTQFLLDLDQDTPRELMNQGDFVRLIDGRQFDAEVAVHFLPDQAIVFYDTDDERGMDEILVYAEKSRAALRLRLESDSTWSLDENLDVPWLDPSLLADRQSQKALVRIQRETGITLQAKL